MISKILKSIFQHKIIAVVTFLILAGGGYFGYKKINSQSVSVQYITATAEKGTLISSISGTGQVLASNQVDINPKVAGDIISVNVKKGQKVKEGDLIVQIDSRDSARSVNEAKANLENAKLDLQELLAPADSLTLMQAENAVVDGKTSLAKLKTTQENNYQETLETKQKAEDNLTKAYEDTYNDIADTFLGLPGIFTGLYTVLFSYEIADSESAVSSSNANNSALLNAVADSKKNDEFKRYLEIAEDDYAEAKVDYDENFSDYKSTSRYSFRAVIEELLSQTIETVKKISDVCKSEINVLDYWVDYQTKKDLRVYSKVSDYQTDLSSYTSETNSYLSSLLTFQRSTKDYKEAITGADRDLAEMVQNNPLDLAASERSLKEKEQKLADLKAGATELEIKSKQLAVQQKENSLIKAQQDYADYFVRAPFNGVAAEVNVVKGDSVSSGSAIMTLITDQKIAEVTLNEVDAAQVKAGQKAILEFDAVSDLSITGEVAEIDTLGTVTQGVVSYNVKVAFDVQDERIKPGMSASVTIIVDSKQDVLLVPIGAVKIQNETNYVEVLVNGQPQKKTVIIGSSNDTMTEIVSGLEEGEKVVTQTVNNGASQSTSQNQNSNRNSPPIGGMMMIR